MHTNPIEAELRELRCHYDDDRQGALDRFSRDYGDALRRVLGRTLRADRAVQERLRDAGKGNRDLTSELVREVGIAILILSGEYDRDQSSNDTLRAAPQETIRLASP